MLFVVFPCHMRNTPWTTLNEWVEKNIFFLQISKGLKDLKKKQKTKS